MAAGGVGVVANEAAGGAVGAACDAVGATAVAEAGAGARRQAADADAATAGADGDRRWGIYVHVPFCLSRCRYCDFNTYSGMGRHIPAYFSALEREIGGFFGAFESGAAAAEGLAGPAGLVAGPPVVDTVFFGGGTPSSVGGDCIKRALEPISRYRDSTASGPWECTLEANPGTVGRRALAEYFSMGVNRLSLGLQSTHEKHLAMLGRRHSFADFARCAEDARAAGFDNISADLMFGLPGQTAGEWARTLDAVLALGVVRHLSCYSLSLEDGTALKADVDGGRLPAPDEDADREMYHYAIGRLKSAGMGHYEISNFAEPGYECRHNLKYWKGGAYRGFGAGAHSFFGSCRYSNAVTIPEYIKKMGGAGSGADGLCGASAGTVADSADDGAGAGVAAGLLGAGVDAGNANSAGAAAGLHGADAGDADAVAGLHGAGAGGVRASAADSAGRKLAGPACAEAIPIGPEEREKEYIILRLRLAEGISSRDFRERFGRGFEQKYAAPLRKLASEGLLQIKTRRSAQDSAIGFRKPAISAQDSAVSLTPKGLDLANRVFVEFI
ncbi:MAG: radical SAM family heme chaperone HemW [Clostridiales bacterium]|nr:radical SAM family heme chaperone HemW [Clostridiales bacterium]